jgi:excisionase family DNA binding protein
MDKPYLELEEIAIILGVTVDTVRDYRRLKNNPLPMYRVGRKYLVKKEDFDDWMEKNRKMQDKP